MTNQDQSPSVGELGYAQACEEWSVHCKTEMAKQTEAVK